jgi:hypothetical protein
MFKKATLVIGGDPVTAAGSPAVSPGNDLRQLT